MLWASPAFIYVEVLEIKTLYEGVLVLFLKTFRSSLGIVICTCTFCEDVLRKRPKTP